ncbi:MAG TPA: glycerol-3-phosphate dehydrogenase/oxidase [Actinomycetota bacterium]
MRELSAATRLRDLEAMADRELDVLVVGGGATGAGVALDAAARGLSVALVERDDFASGTSGRSSRLIHGGLRYLRHGDVRIVRESLRERGILSRVAPHLVRPFPILMPARGAVDRSMLRAALTTYGLLAGGGPLGRFRRVGGRDAARLAPAVERPAGFVFPDCKTDDARLTIEVIRQASARGALVANHAEVVDLIGEATVTGARIRDRAGEGSLEVRARVVVNAGGAWADRVQALAHPSPARLRPSKGVHLVLDRARLPIEAGLFVPSVVGFASFVFAIPWGPRVYAGTTDTPFEGDLDRPTVEPEDAGIVLSSLERAVRRDLTADDVVASWAGVRPLLDRGGASTRDLSRRHVVWEDPPGLISVTGGKLTTFRAMAEEVVDRVAQKLGRGEPCATARLPLGLTRPLDDAIRHAEAEAGALHHPPALGRRMVALYGDDAAEALRRVADDPGLAEPLAPGLPVRRVEAVLAREREMALTDEDVLVRRTRLARMDEAAAERARSTLPP